MGVPFVSGWSEFVSSVTEWFGSFGLLGLAGLSFTEAFIQPIPPDALVIPMAATSSEPSWLVSVFLVVTVSSVLGSLVAWWMGDKFGNPLLERFASPKAVEKFNLLVTKYGTFGIFIAAFSPIPYKVLGWCAGIGKMDKHSFILAGTVGRSLRFGVEVAVVGLYGEQFLEFLIGPGFVVVTLAVALLAYPSWRWWNGLEVTDKEE
uniref:Putative membrane SNARE associated-like protein n=1 Tax=uncultured marine group II/III euryarchaeote KM3_33_F08 TaxID=1456435 RepID=A0A075H4N1_9EURY|nr:putative membrane SNARE associated-like protein [uncultured marine group II/III euryarchaeote KM3_33_F08]